MRKTLIFMVFTFMCLSFFSKSLNADVLEHSAYLEKHQWGVLEDIMADWKSGKITTDECILYGCYVLDAYEPARTDKSEKTKLLPSRYKLDKKSAEEGPYFFIYQIYKNENTLGQKALEEFHKSEWSDYEFIEDFTNNKSFTEIIMNTPLKSCDNNEYRDYYNICATALQNKAIMPQTITYTHELAHSGLNIKRYKEKITPFNKKYKLKLSISSMNFLNFLFSEFQDIKFQNDDQRTLKDRKLKNLINYLYYSSSKTGGIPTFYKDGFNVKGIGVDEKIVEQYCNWLIEYKNKMVNYGLREPINFWNQTITLEVMLLDDYCPDNNYYNYYASTNITPPGNNIKTRCNIEFFLKKITEDIKIAPPEKHIIHELMHSISYSYDNKKSSISEYHWYLYNKFNDSTDCVETVSESIASWAEDNFFKSDASYQNKLSTVFKSVNYFFEDYQKGNFIFPTVGMLYNKKYYSYSYFFRFLCQQFGEDFVKKMWELIESKKVTDSFKTLIETKSKTVAAVLQDFGIKNYFLTKIKGVFPDEDIFIKSDEIWNNVNLSSPFPVLSIRNELLPDVITADKKIPPYGTKFFKLAPSDSSYFDKCVTIDFSWTKDVSDIKISVISCWKDNQNIKGYLNTPVLYGGQLAKYQYFTKKGLNPSQFIIAITNGDIKEHSIAISVSFSKSDLLNPSYNKDFNKTLSALAGNEYKENVQAVYSIWKQRCEMVDKKVCDQILLYNGKEYALKQIIESLKELNLSMQEAIVSVHDLRYQFYLRKNYIVNKICDGATSASVLDQLKRLKEYDEDILATLNASSDKIVSVIGEMVGDHAIVYLLNTKNSETWTDEETKVSQDMQKIKDKIQTIWRKSSYYYANNEWGDAYAAVGSSEIEIYAKYIPGMPPTPALVNVPPNMNKEAFAVNQIFKISDTIKNFTAVNYKEYLFSDTCNPLDMKYFSIIKKHDYRETFMPPVPGSTTYFAELNDMAYFRRIAPKYNFDRDGISSDTIISALSRKFDEFKRRTIDTIMMQLHKGNFELLNTIKTNVKNVSAKDELIKILGDALACIKSAEILENNNTVSVKQATEKINEILLLLNK